jgi:hypothetical protein
MIVWPRPRPVAGFECGFGFTTTFGFKDDFVFVSRIGAVAAMPEGRRDPPCGETLIPVGSLYSAARPLTAASAATGRTSAAATKAVERDVENFIVALLV